MLNNVISIIVPVYNTEKYIERCLDSVLNQTYRNLEVIVVDDCSPGNVDEIIQSYLNRDDRVKYARHEKNKGLFLARLTGASLASGDYIAFVDSDDYVTMDYYHTLLKSAVTHDSDIVVGKTIYQKINDEKHIDNLHDCCFAFDELNGSEVQEHFFEQKGLCYSWHTIWNKLYKKELWDQCSPYYHQITQHLIMTEDVAFSTPLFYFAKKVTAVQNDGYFYCENATASTNVEKITLKRFEKNMVDIKLSFDFVGGFLKEVQAPEQYRSDFLEFRKHYSSLWRTLGETTFSGLERKKVLEIMENFLPDYYEYSISDDYFFDSVQTKWNGGLEYIKKQIVESACQYVSFDIFDTAVVRPLYKPTDLFCLLDKKFEELMRCNISFQKIRIAAEEGARYRIGATHPSFQDVTIDEIYQFMGESYHLSSETTSAMMAEEKRLEIALCRQRKAAKELYDVALICGKKVIFTSDMYLDEDTIKAILKKSGYEGYTKLYLSSTLRMTKHEQSLYHAVLEDLHVKGNCVLHIGDTWENDIIGAQACGLSTIFFPKAIEAFENKISGMQTSGCSTAANTACGCVLNAGQLMKSLGMRTMLATIANRYFDNPYRSFNEQSDFNIDPWLIGYYPLGMHMLGLSKWILEAAQKDGYEAIHFLARDGYLPMQAYEMLANYYAGAPKSDYLYASRKALMPAMLLCNLDFYDLPVEFHNHSPKTLLQILKFCTKDDVEEEFSETLKKDGFLYHKIFTSKSEFRHFITFFLDHLYSPQKHEEAKNIARSYFKGLNSKKDAAFDLGYSCRIQAAISHLAEQGINVLFIHNDGQRAPALQRKEHFKTDCFYDFTPNMTGLIREHILSDPGGSCIGFRMENGQVVPILEDEEKTFQDRFIVSAMQRGALDFCRDFLDCFGEYLDYLPFKSQEVSLPFEGFLRNMKDIDRRVFIASYFEDMVYGASDKINIYHFVKHQYASMPGTMGASGMMEYGDAVQTVLYGHGKLAKLFVYSIFDRGTLKEKVKFKLKNHPLLFCFCKRGYKALKRIKKLKKR